VNELVFGDWRKSSRSSGGGNCVEMAVAVDGRYVGLRDSKNRGAGRLVIPAAGWVTFVEAVRGGAFDLT
jgi:hypothetical protein